MQPCDCLETARALQAFPLVFCWVVWSGNFVQNKLKEGGKKKRVKRCSVCLRACNSEHILPHFHLNENFYKLQSRKTETKERPVRLSLRAAITQRQRANSENFLPGSRHQTAETLKKKPPSSGLFWCNAHRSSCCFHRHKLWAPLKHQTSVFLVFFFF